MLHPQFMTAEALLTDLQEQLEDILSEFRRNPRYFDTEAVVRYTKRAREIAQELQVRAAPDYDATKRKDWRTKFQFNCLLCGEWVSCAEENTHPAVCVAIPREARP